MLLGLRDDNLHPVEELFPSQVALAAFVEVVKALVEDSLVVHPALLESLHELVSADAHRFLDCGSLQLIIDVLVDLLPMSPFGSVSASLPIEDELSLGEELILLVLVGHCQLGETLVLGVEVVELLPVERRVFSHVVDILVAEEVELVVLLVYQFGIGVLDQRVDEFGLVVVVEEATFETVLDLIDVLRLHREKFLLHVLLDWLVDLTAHEFGSTFDMASCFGEYIVPTFRRSNFITLDSKRIQRGV